jgi:DNA-binding GntR family transcriptional regulator
MESDDWARQSDPYLVPSDGRPGDAWSRESAQQGRQGTQRLLEVAQTVPPARVAKALRIADGTPAVVRRRLMLLDDEPAQLADSWYPLGVAEGTALAEPRKIRGGAVTLLAELGYTPDAVREHWASRPATSEECLTLGLTAGAAVDELFRLLETADGVPYEVSFERWPVSIGSSTNAPS